MKCKNCKNLINGWCEKKLDSPAPETERKCGDYEVKTNYDHIKQMSIDEMTAYHVRDIICSRCEARKMCKELHTNPEFMKLNCVDRFQKWLESEVEK